MLPPPPANAPHRLRGVPWSRGMFLFQGLLGHLDIGRRQFRLVSLPCMDGSAQRVLKLDDSHLEGRMPASAPARPTGWLSRTARAWTARLPTRPTPSRKAFNRTTTMLKRMAGHLSSVGRTATVAPRPRLSGRSTAQAWLSKITTSAVWSGSQRGMARSCTQVASGRARGSACLDKSV